MRALSFGEYALVSGGEDGGDYSACLEMELTNPTLEGIFNCIDLVIDSMRDRFGETSSPYYDDLRSENYISDQAAAEGGHEFGGCQNLELESFSCDDWTVG